MIRDDIAQPPPHPALKLIVGNEKKEFSVNKTLICSVFDFFKAACSPLWENGWRNPVTLLDEDPVFYPLTDPALFAIFLAWLHTKEVWRAVEYIKDDYWDTEKRVLQMQKQFFQLACCYALGDMLQATSFQNAIMDHLVRQSHQIHNMQSEETIGGILNDIIFAATLYDPPNHKIRPCASISGVTPYQSASISAHARFLRRPHEICCRGKLFIRV